MTSIYSFIAYISAKIGGGAVSMREGMLKFRRLDLLGSLLPSGLPGSPSFGIVTLVFLLNIVSCVSLT